MKIHPGPWDHDLSQRQTLNWLSHPGSALLNLYFLFISTRGCFGILGCLRCIQFAGEESLREVLVVFPRPSWRKAFAGSAFSKSKSNSYSTPRFTPFTPTCGHGKVTFGIWDSPSPQDLGPLSNPTPVGRLVSCFMDQHGSGCDRILGDIMSCQY